MARKINKKHKELKLRKYFGILFLLLMGLVFWQLYRAPVSLPFLKPYIIKALNHDDSDYEVSLSSVNLELVKSIKPIKIVANNVVYKNASKTLSIDAPKVSVSFSIQALLKGMIAPSGIEIRSPNIYIFRTYGIDSEEEKKVSQKVINQKKIEAYIDEFNLFMERFNDEEKIYSESYINSIDIINASVELHEIDLGKKTVFSDMNYNFYRGFSDIKISFSSFLSGDDVSSPVGLELEYRPATNNLAIDVFASDFVPAKTVGEVFGANIDVPLSARIQTLIDLNKIIENKDNVVVGFEEALKKIVFEFEGGDGEIKFEGLEDYTYKVSQILLKGDIQGGLDKLEVNNALFDIDTQKIAVGFSAVGMRKLLLENSYEDIKLSVFAKTNNLPFDNLTNLWPKYIAPQGWSWCKDSLKNGLAKDVDFRFDFEFDKKQKSIAFKELNGKVDLFDANVDYLDGMPPIKNVYGVASFDNSSIKIDIQKGVSDGVSLNGGYVKLYDLEKDDPAIDILLKATSSIKDAIALISNPPLEFDKEIGLPADSIAGFAEIELSLKFLLLKDILAKDVNVNLSAVAEDVFVPNVLKDLGFKSSTLNLKLNNNNMNIYGDGFIDEVPVNLNWVEDFNQKDYKSKYALKFEFNKNLKQKLGVDFSVLRPPYIVGRPEITANITVLKNEQSKINLSADLTNTTLDFAFLGIVKENGEVASIEANLDFDEERLIDIPHFSFNQEEFELGGNIVLDNNSRVKKVNIPEISGDKTLANAVVNVDYNNKEPVYNIDITGRSYNLIKFFGRDTLSYRKYAIAQKNEGALQTDNETDGLEDTNNANISISVDSLWTINEMPIKNFVGDARLIHGVGVEELHLTGNYANTPNSMIKLDYSPRGKEYFLDIESNDAGATLKVLGLYDYMREGDLKIQAKRGADKNLIGHAKIRSFKLYNTPGLTKLLTVASLSGILDMLTGDGLVFTHFDAPFEYKNKILKTQSAKASGNVMVITANGTFNRFNDVVDIKGVIAPLRGLDNLLSNIPLLGSLIKGSDGTVFAANYEIVGTGKKPDVNINPFSRLSEKSSKDLMGVSVDE